MSTPKVGDRVRIIYNGQTNILEISEIHGATMILVNGEFRTSLTWSGSNWILPGNIPISPSDVILIVAPTTNTIVEPSSNFSFTGHELTDIEVLIYLDQPTFENACKTSRYSRQLCNGPKNNILYKGRIQLHYPTIFEELENDKIRDWKHVYDRLIYFEKLWSNGNEFHDIFDRINDVIDYKIVNKIYSQKREFQIPRITHPDALKLIDTLGIIKVFFDMRKYDIVKYILENNVLTDRDAQFVLFYIIRKEYSLNMDLVSFLIDKYPNSITENVVELAAINNNLPLVELFASKGHLPRIDYLQLVYFKKGNLPMAKFLYSKGLIPNQPIFEQVVALDDLEKFEWLLSLGFQPTIEIANLAYRNNAKRILGFLKNIAIIPTETRPIEEIKPSCQNQIQ